MPNTMSSASRRLLTALITGALLLTSCGDDDAPSDSSAEATEAEEVEAGTRTVEHAMGTTEVPDDPERVVVLDSSFLDAALALDVEPVGATEAETGAGMPAYLADEVPDIEVVGLTDEPNLEAVAALRRTSSWAPKSVTRSSTTNWPASHPPSSPSRPARTGRTASP